MAKRSFDSSDNAPKFAPFPQSVALESLVGKNLSMQKFSWEEGEKGTYLSLRIADNETGQIFICGTRATIVMQQLQSLNPDTDCPFDFSVAKNNRSLSLVSVGDGGTYTTNDNLSDLPDMQS